MVARMYSGTQYLVNGLLVGRPTIGRFAQYQRLSPHGKVQRAAHRAPPAGTDCMLIVFSPAGALW
jgi:hypothetical protein